MTGFAIQNSYLQAHQDVVQRAVTSILQAIQKEKSDKAYTEQEMAKYMGVKGKGEADYTYNFYAKTLAPSVPVPTVSQFAGTKTGLAKKDPKVSNVNLNDLVDPAFVQTAAKQLGISGNSSG
jgi:ABC-type nitrate/sulfonate/bicarbonate transport system substrate-binding protein